VYLATREYFFIAIAHHPWDVVKSLFYSVDSYGFVGVDGGAVMDAQRKAAVESIAADDIGRKSRGGRGSI
jgi:hypothetical protein